MYYSQNSGGFYDEGIHGESMPPDCIEVSDALYRALMEGQAQGRAIVAGAGGHPRLSEIAPRSIEEAREELLQRVAAARWKREVAGIQVGEIQVGTSASDQSRLTSILSAASMGVVEDINFKAVSGWVTLSIEQLRHVAGTVAAHVQACFAAEMVHHDAIMAIDSIVGLENYEIEANWPNESASP
jgi:hypothetical protein